MRRFLLLTAMFAMPTASAHAGFFSAQPVDATPEVVSVGDVDVARDGSGAVAYVRKDGGVDHIFVSRLVNGVWQPAERVDGGLDAASSQPAVAASDGGKLAVVFISGGQAFNVIRPAGATAWTAPALLGVAASNPSIDMSIHGVAYATFTSGGDVRAARLGRKDPGFTVLDPALDVEQGRTAGAGAGRSRVAMSAEGSAVATWVEDGFVVARRLFGTQISTAPQTLNLDALDGRSGGAGDSPEIDMEDDASFGYVVFRQAFNDGGTPRIRSIARRLVGSNFEAPVVIDGLDWGGQSAALPRVELNGRGEGLLTSATDGGFLFGHPIKDEKTTQSAGLGGGGLPPQAVPTIAETQDRVVAYFTGTSAAEAQVRARLYDDKPESRAVPFPQDEVVLSDPALGAVDPGAGLDAAMNRAGDVVVVFVQGTGPDRKLVSGSFDRAPGSFSGFTSGKPWRKRTDLKWGPSFELWGPPTYRVELDGTPIGETTETQIAVPPSFKDGEHKYRIFATDRRGQVAATPTRTVRIDGSAPELSFRTRRRGAVASVTVKANDVVPPGGRASGVAVVRIDFGDGVRVARRRASHRYGRKGRFTIRVSATDRAGNATVETKRIRVR